MNETMVLDIIIFGCIVSILYVLLKKTDVVKMVAGIGILCVSALFVKQIGLLKSFAFLDGLSPLVVTGLIVVFQSEIRIILKKLGSVLKFVGKKRDNTSSLREIEKAIFELSQEKTGALIIIDDKGHVAHQSENFYFIDSLCTSELIETIFFPNTKLHDGAIIVTNNKITYAACMLPITGKKIKGYENLGTRHLAAMETAHAFNVVGIIVSEETGTISLTDGNKIYKATTREEFRRFFDKKNL